MSMTPKLEVNGVGFLYHTLEGETKALSDISFHVNSGEFLCIVGPSGCGKSTLLSLLSGLFGAGGGEILWMGSRSRRECPGSGICCRGIICLSGARFFKCFSGLEVQGSVIPGISGG